MGGGFVIGSGRYYVFCFNKKIIVFHIKRKISIKKKQYLLFNEDYWQTRSSKFSESYHMPKLIYVWYQKIDLLAINGENLIEFFTSCVFAIIFTFLALFQHSLIFKYYKKLVLNIAESSFLAEAIFKKIFCFKWIMEVKKKL